MTFTFDALACTVTGFSIVSGALSEVTIAVDTASGTPQLIKLPIYQVEPCGSLLPYTRTIELVNANPLPGFLTISDADGVIKVTNNDISNMGTYQLRVVAREPVTGLTNSAVAFSLTLNCPIRRFYTVVDVKNLQYEV